MQRDAPGLPRHGYIYPFDALLADIDFLEVALAHRRGQILLEHEDKILDKRCGVDVIHGRLLFKN